jgi:AraC-like DNA-binding protein
MMTILVAAEVPGHRLARSSERDGRTGLRNPCTIYRLAGSLLVRAGTAWEPAPMHDSPSLAALVARHAPQDGIFTTALPRLALMRSSAVTAQMPTVYEPALCLVVGGAKEAQLGDRRFRYDAASFLLGNVDIPVTGAVVEASPERPFLCLRLDIDRTLLAELVGHHPAPVSDRPTLGLTLERTTPALLDAAGRLLALLEEPADATVLAPLAERELLWRVLRGPAGPLLRHLASADSHVAQIGRAIAWLRAHYAEPVVIDQLAALAGMSASAFHQHFKTVTGLSPLQFRTRLRLHQARLLMTAEAVDAASAGFQVGYGSPSQFSRDYVRAFGMPPARDAARLRAGGPVAFNV